VQFASAASAVERAVATTSPPWLLMGWDEERRRRGGRVTPRFRGVRSKKGSQRSHVTMACVGALRIARMRNRHTDSSLRCGQCRRPSAQNDTAFAGVREGRPPVVFPPFRAGTSSKPAPFKKRRVRHPKNRGLARNDGVCGRSANCTDAESSHRFFAALRPTPPPLRSE
jgi:hypothetical protein